MIWVGIALGVLLFVIVLLALYPLILKTPFTSVAAPFTRVVSFVVHTCTVADIMGSLEPFSITIPERLNLD